VIFLDNIEQLVAAYPLLAFGAVFLAGVLSSATPCVLATIPLVVGFVGGYSNGDRWKAFRYSLTFILGLSLTFTAFGAAAGLLGTMFGTLGGPWAHRHCNGRPADGFLRNQASHRAGFQTETGLADRFVPVGALLRSFLLRLRHRY